MRQELSPNVYSPVVPAERMNERCRSGLWPLLQDVFIGWRRLSLITVTAVTFFVAFPSEGEESRTGAKVRIREWKSSFVGNESETVVSWKKSFTKEEMTQRVMD